ncbi:DUF2076 family protein [Leifsonia sp. 71-9]|uniref:DUF2076 family protein n=1 Tax=Leifsonia sp. 71-9 TaxID=1895934 RepID=UPI00092AF9BC|nr:DUF2076 family protein [Leifsonia sp. 71-9]OJX77506.1 MAG: hypothetical protein BGO91_10265 [Leifsonia sp. 71-9]
MDTNDIRMIADLAESIRVASPVEKDAESAGLITHLIASQPDAVYFLVQTVLVQKLALEAAERGSQGARAAAPEPVEQPGAQRRGFGGFFGGRRGDAPVSPAPATAPAPAASGGGSFLKTAAAGAAGVAGGVLLAQGISGLFDGGASHRADPGADDTFGDDGYDGGFDDDWSDA